ncbi:type IV secretion system DNA-binding domain-containing protein [Candidatus Uhrbacteria bacterium]|nr:type IV secretion system DNA-binding domain-containing protein [Candidatus Uhrbacteria bacterium]
MSDASTAITIAGVLAGIVILAIIALFVLRGYLRNHASLKRTFEMAVLQILVPKEAAEKEGGGGELEKIQQAIARTEAFFTSIGGLRAQHGFRSWLTGRGDHFAFEMVAVGGQVKFFVAVPRASQSYLEEQLHAQEPNAYVEEARDYNIFQPGGVILARTLRCQRPGYFPLRSYKKLEVDPLNALTNAMSKVPVSDGAAIQYIVRSARKEWRSGGVRIARKMQQGMTLEKASKSGFWTAITSGFSAASGKKKHDPSEKQYQLSPMEQEVVKGLEEKAAKFGVDVNVRIVVSSPNRASAQTALDSVTQAFFQYNVPQYGNMLVASGASTKSKLIRQFIYRHFDEARRIVLNVEEMASVWHLPLPSAETPNIQWLVARRAAPPVGMPQEGIILGEAVYRGRRTIVRLKRADRQRHMYLIGGTGTGKSTLMEEMAKQDILAGEGVCIIDPHGSFVENVLPCIPRERADDVIIFNPSDVERPVGLNMLEADTPEAQDFATQEMIAIFYKLVTDPSMIGPMFEHYMRNAMLTLMSDPKNPGTLVEIPRILTDPAFQKLKLKTVTDPIIRAFWEKELPQTSGQTKGEMLPYLVSKIGRFIENTMVRNIIGQQHSGFDFREVMDKRKILLVNLSKGKVGEMNATLMGLIIVTKLQMAALARADMPEADRKDFYLYIDEFQNFVTDSIATILAEARKYRLNLIMAHQYIGQLVQNNDTRVRDAIFGNVGTIISYRIGVDDSETIAKQLAPVVTEFDLLNIEKYNAYIRLMIDNTAQRAFNFKTFAPKKGDARVAEALLQLSRLKHGRDRAIVESEIVERSQLG